jgi:hypothetical protein
VLERRHDTEPGHDQTSVGADQLGRHAHVTGERHRVVRAHADEVDPDRLAHHAVPAVRADQERRLDRLPPAKLDRHRVLVPGQPGDLVSWPDLDAQLGRALGEHLLDPALRHHQQVERVVRQVAQVERERAEHVPRRGPGDGPWLGQPLVEAAPVQHAHHLTDEAVGTLLGGRFGTALQDERAGAGQGELAGEHQAVGPGTRDDDVDHVLSVSGQGTSARPPAGRPSTMDI